MDMNSNQDDQTPARPVNYVPYFYDSGRFLRYGLPAWQPRPRFNDWQSAFYDFSSDTPIGWRLDSFQTVEQIIQRGYLAVPKVDPVTAILSDKRHTSRLGLDDVISQIRQRYEVYSENMADMDQSACEASNSVFRQMADHGLRVANQRQQYSAQKQIQKIYEQKRMERVNLWRDVSRLRLGLPESAQQYLSAYRKLSALESDPGDAP